MWCYLYSPGSIKYSSPDYLLDIECVLTPTFNHYESICLVGDFTVILE
jgi:hypothetical protein